LSRVVELVAGPEHEGHRLDATLAAVPEIGSRAAARRLVEAGRVTVDGRARRGRHRLRAGERLTADIETATAPPAGKPAPAATHAVVHEDEDLIVVDKPAGVVVHPARGHPTGTLSQALAARAGGGSAWRPGIVHRLDRDTSGLLVVAKSERVHRALQGLIRTRALEREYTALVDGRPDAVSGTIDAPLGRDRRTRTAISTRTDRPREARTHFRRLEPLPRSTLLAVRLETGRTHQIRAHFAAIGHPILGDRAYGGDARERLGLARQFLHAAHLAFPHPVTGERVDLSSQLPADLERALRRAHEE
jgi:23S rRNA pseudouridine1911/1915/1917 synthase